MKSKIQNQKSKIIGLTGPIASGKNTVCKFLRRRKACVIDADKIGHEVLRIQSPEWHEVFKLFGSKVLMRGGKVNRRKLGNIVFSNPKLLNKLNKIMHPRMVKEIKSEIRNPKSEQCKIIIINAAVLKEMGLIPLVDEVWVVLAPKEKRLKWLMKEKGFAKRQAMARIKAQPKDKDYLRIADKVIRNDGTIKQLKQKVLVSYSHATCRV